MKNVQEYVIEQLNHHAQPSRIVVAKTSDDSKTALGCPDGMMTVDFTGKQYKLHKEEVQNKGPL